MYIYIHNTPETQFCSKGLGFSCSEPVVIRANGHLLTKLLGFPEHFSGLWFLVFLYRLADPIEVHASMRNRCIVGVSAFERVAIFGPLRTCPPTGSDGRGRQRVSESRGSPFSEQNRKSPKKVQIIHVFPEYGAVSGGTTLLVEKASGPMSPMRPACARSCYTKVEVGAVPDHFLVPLSWNCPALDSQGTV